VRNADARLIFTRAKQKWFSRLGGSATGDQYARRTGFESSPLPGW